MAQNIIKIVQTNLRSRGYRVRKLSDTALGFDLLVQDKFRVLCIRQKEVITIKSDQDINFDVIAMVSFDAAKRPVIQYSNRDFGFKPTVSPKEVFGEVKSKGKNESKKIKGKSESEKVSANG